MISVLHLLWIVPLSGIIGFLSAALLVANRKGGLCNPDEE